ncbi:MAG: hypothetical protein HMLKMBBP_00622 [Planctomycetes bacterium]|nr:hypothetical protein [Planctomycetota bacterium]
MLWIALALASGSAAVVSGALGMAGGLLLLTFMAAVLPMDAAFVLHGVAQAASNGSRWVIHRRHVDGANCLRFAVGAAAAAAAAWALRWRLDPGVVHLAVGAVPFAALALRSRIALDFERRGGAVACGAAVTATQLTAGVAGPLLDVFFVRSPRGRHAVVATKACTQTLAHVVKVAWFAAMGRDAGAVEPAGAACCAVAAVGGTILGTRVLDRMDDRAFRRIGAVLVLGLGAWHLWTGARLVSAAAQP